MSKQRKGYVYERGKSWVARITYLDDSGEQRSIRRSFPSKSQANNGLKQLVRELDERGSQFLTLDRRTFNDLADYYEGQYMVAPVYVDGRKVAGLRSYEDQKRRLKVLREYLGKRKLRELTYGDIEKFKLELLAKPTHRDKPRTLADVHRVLTILRSMLKVAEREDWIIRSPFGRGKPLVTMADEKPRERVLSREEEQRLLAACTGRRAQLKAVLICALDTGMRRGEIISLKWKQVDLIGRLIHIEAFNTKTMRARTLPMTERLAAELRGIYEQSDDDPEGQVFISRGWLQNILKRACKDAGIVDFRLHDCRHTCATRLVQGGLPLAEVGRILGHTTLTMTYRYTNADNTTLVRAVAILDALSIPNQTDFEVLTTMIN